MTYTEMKLQILTALLQNPSVFNPNVNSEVAREISIMVSSGIKYTDDEIAAMSKALSKKNLHITKLFECFEQLIHEMERRKLNFYDIKGYSDS